MAVPMANDPPFATLNHFAADLGIPSESDLLRIGITLPTKRDYETIGAGDLIDVVATPFELDPAFDDVAKIIFRNLAAIILFPAVIGPLQAAPEIMTQAVVSGMFGH
jgi:hypothetical protein